MAAGAVLVRPFAGRVMDGGGGRRVVVLVGGVGHVVACLGYFAVSDVGPLLWIVRVVHGLSEGALFAGLFTLAADIVPAARRTEGLALFGVSGMLPVALGGLLGDLVLAQADYPALFALASSCALLATAASFALPETSVRRAADAPPRVGRGFLAVALQPDLVPIWTVGIAFAGALGAAYAFLKSFVEGEHVGSLGLFYGAYSAVAIVLRITLGWVPDRVGPTRVLAPSLVAISLALAALAGASETWHIAAAGALAGLGHAYVFPSCSSLTVVRSRDEERGTALSLFTAIFDVGMLLAAPLFGAVVDASSLRTMFVVAACVPVVGGVLFHVLDARRLRQPT